MSLAENFSELLVRGVLSTLANLAGPPPPHFPAIQAVGELDFRVWMDRARPGVLVRLNPAVQSVRAEDNFLLAVMLAALEALQRLRAGGQSEAAMEVDSDDEGPPPLIGPDGTIVY
jgi:hypothetical protein